MNSITVSATNLNKVIDLVSKLDIKAHVSATEGIEVSFPNGFSYTKRCYEIWNLSENDFTALQKRLNRYRNITVERVNGK